MKSPPANEVLDRELLSIRARLIDLAAGLDRLSRAEGSLGGIADQPRWRSIVRSLEILADGQGDRAARVQEAFSLPYDDHWREAFLGGDR
jgi:hypothetical protein